MFMYFSKTSVHKLSPSVYKVHVNDMHAYMKFRRYIDMLLTHNATYRGIPLDTMLNRDHRVAKIRNGTFFENN